ncbi:hypothetical protein RV14_GL002067 [Enterococcus ratti]|uniref:Uncharacterized protein n=2 Tax=Enterococcus ratti TaxID=150033 RepID=A0A1L8WP34_9ENTE|nr:hypothetical protein RV14_GL002067 [Enterococcus ratti]
MGCDKLMMNIQLTNVSRSQIKKEINDWLVFIRIIFEPSFFQSSHQIKQPFDWQTFSREAIKECYFLSGNLSVGDDYNECNIYFKDQQLLIKNILKKESFFLNESVIRDYVKIKMEKNGIFAYIRAYDEFIYHNTKEINERFTFETAEEIERLPKMKGLSNKIVIDCNQFPGYDLFYEGMCFTSCWEMYYSSHYYQMIPKQMFLEVQQVEYIKEYQNEVIEIQLYRDPFKWQEAVNLHFQVYYRDQLGFDHLAWDNGVGVLKAPFVEYAYTNCGIQSVQYQNEYMQPTQKKLAVFFVTRNYHAEKNECCEKRVKGRLNAQAYFPLKDEERAQMMFCKAIDPRISLDNGIEAYCYYIREYLEISVEDEQYKEYLAVLRLYVPAENVRRVPLNEIRKRLPDIKFKRFRKRRKFFSFDVKKGENHLRVEFYNDPRLNKFETLQKNEVDRLWPQESRISNNIVE